MNSDYLICLYCTFAFTAVCLSIGSVSWCEFVEFVLPNGLTVAAGAWRYQTFYLVTVDTDLYTVATCTSLPDDWDVDTKTMSSRVFGVLAPLLGTLAGIALIKSAKLAAGLFFWTTIAQGLTLLLLKSNMCSIETNPAFAEYQEELAGVSDCKIGRSAVVSIVATSFYAICGVLAVLYGAAASKEDSEDEIAASGGDGDGAVDGGKGDEDA